MIKIMTCTSRKINEPIYVKNYKDVKNFIIENKAEHVFVIDEKEDKGINCSLTANGNLRKS